MNGIFEDKIDINLKNQMEKLGIFCKDKSKDYSNQI